MIEELEKQVRAVSNRLATFDEQEEKIANVIEFVDTYDNSSVIITLAPGVYFEPGKSRFLVYVGCDIIVEKTAKDLREMMFEQLNLTEEYRERLMKKLIELSNKADEVQNVRLSQG